MIKDYCDDNNLNMNTKAISEILYKYTSGYPFFVSRLCQIINEDMHVLVWDEQVILKAIKILLNEKNTLFDDLIKNVENNKELQDYIYDLIINGTEKSFVIDNKIIDMCYMFGYFKEVDGKVKIANNIFKQRLYNYFSSKIEENIDMSYYNFKDNFVTNTGLDFEKVLLKFQQFFEEQYSTLDSKFIEREGRLLFLAFIKPIINGTGFDFKEVQISEEKRLDVIVTYLKEKYLVELKIWRGEEYHKKGLKQLVEYLDNQDLDVGYLLIYNFNKGKEYKYEKLMIDNKEIFIVWV